MLTLVWWAKYRGNVSTSMAKYRGNVSTSMAKNRGNVSTSMAKYKGNVLILVHLIYFLFPLKGTHESILEKQSTFDALAERAQTLLQSTTDNRVTSQLTQLSARYTTLMSASKDLLKRYEQHVLDHEQYAESFTEAATWLQNII
jgi:hypothetical protein